jgi:chemotaxis protein methyltransferase CheR
MRDADCIEFLRWALPRLRLRWQGFRKVRRQVCRRIERRVEELGLAGGADYRAYLAANPGEWARLDELCHVTVSRFYRDRGACELLRDEVLPELAGQAVVEAWSAGCASGEEPYTLALIWHFGVAPRFPSAALRILATDVDEAVLGRALMAEYPVSSLRELPQEWRLAAFEALGDRYRLRDELRSSVTFLRHDVRCEPPGGPYDLVLCRNLAFTYFAEELQREVAARLASCIRPGGALVLGTHERLPLEVAAFAPRSETLRVYRRT